MVIAMAVLGVGALFAGWIQVPGIDATLEHLFDPVFENSPLFEIHPSTLDAYIGMAVGSLLSILGIGLAYYLYIVAPGSTDRIRARATSLYRLFVNKWYFDEIQDALVYRPIVACGRFANDVFERVVVQGIVSGVREGVDGAGGAIRGLQSGFVRFYSLLVIAGIVGISLYFLIRAA
jgi:NADH-quinone oxidoreductase subunit L